ncbi:hypothetical protein EPH_0047680 [Eimeria praecox]|uniref:Uncharacterized protein n=1 Tax=Eimeria praecox TaxID=51316 RepID=U6GX83_9EIME|nr:hypothetical protein EPH_0047680 [Eimeria praecox]
MGLRKGMMLPDTPCTYVEPAFAAIIQSFLGAGPNGILVSPEWEDKIIGGGRPVMMEAAEAEDDLQTLGAQLELEDSRDEVEEMKRAANGFCRRDTDGPDD